MRRPLGLLNQKPSKNQGKGILECGGVEQLISRSLPGSRSSYSFTYNGTQSHTLHKAKSHMTIRSPDSPTVLL